MLKLIMAQVKDTKLLHAPITLSDLRSATDLNGLRLLDPQPSLSEAAAYAPDRLS